jgi:hypothetical protein
MQVFSVSIYGIYIYSLQILIEDCGIWNEERESASESGCGVAGW